MAAEGEGGDDFHTFKVGGSSFQILRKYALIRPVGQGAYGVVISAQDSVTGRKVAIKKIHHAFRDTLDAKRLLREIKLLRQLRHENIISIVDILPPPHGGGPGPAWEDLYIVNELMETDLHRIVQSPQPLSMDHIQYFVYQILRALKYMHSAGVVHRDLKPSNILLNSNCDLKVCDLGLARGMEDVGGGLTEYVVTRWYRAPEVMLACQEYTKVIDVWSAGCILGELLDRQPLFKGENYIDQLRKICERLGRPDVEDLDFITTDKAKRFILTLPDTPTRPLLEKSCDPAALDLLQKMLVFNPAKRISVVEALQHPFMASLHDEADEPAAPFTIDFDFEGETLSREDIQRLIWEEMAYYHPETRSSDRPHTRPRTRTRTRRGERRIQDPLSSAAAAMVQGGALSLGSGSSGNSTLAGGVRGVVQPMETATRGLAAADDAGTDGAPTRAAWHSAHGVVDGSSNSGSRAGSSGRGRSRAQEKDSGPDAKNSHSSGQQRGDQGWDDKDQGPRRTRRLHRDSKGDQGAEEGAGDGEGARPMETDFDNDDAPATAPAKHATRPRSTTERSRKTQRK